MYTRTHILHAVMHVQWPSWLNWQSTAPDYRELVCLILIEGLEVTFFTTGLGGVFTLAKIRSH